MSSKPSIAGTQAVLAVLRRQRMLSNEMEELQRKVVRLKEAEQEYGACTALLWDLLNGMDIASTGNFGFEGRMTWFLSRLITEAGDGYKPTGELSVEQIKTLIDSALPDAKRFYARLRFAYGYPEETK